MAAQVAAGGPGEPPAQAANGASGGRTLAEHLISDEDTAVFAILMPSNFTMKEGAPLWPGVQLGKFLGAGAQAKVFQLADDTGKPTGKVIKINHGDIGSKMLNNNVVWVGMDREWEVGTQLRAALQEPDGSVPGFMKVCDCLVSTSSTGKEAGFSGMIIGELHGWEVYKRIDTPEFHNIHYVREMLFQVFSALDRAQSKVGFLHADLGMRNVMEHYPRLWEEMPEAEAEAAKAALQRPGFTVNQDGTRLPLGPEVEFKIIDFGIAKFSSKLAAAAAGSEAQEVVQELHDRFGRNERVIFKCTGVEEDTSIKFEHSDVTKEPPGLTTRLKCMLTMRGPSRLIVRHTACAVKAGGAAATAAAAKMAQAVGASKKPGDRPSQLQEAEQQEDKPAAAGHNDDLGLPQRLASIEPAAFARAAAAAAESRGSLEPLTSSAGARPKTTKKKKKKKSPIETMYRHFWHRKGDVVHLLLNIALVLDDRLWPEEDEDEVQALCSLVHHVTGIKMQARHGAAAVAAGRTPFGRHQWQHWFKRWAIRLKGHFLPYNSGLLAREALSHPFFGAGRVKHARVPEQLDAAFPPGEA